MAHSERWAKRLLGRLSTVDPEELLESPSFADPTFLVLFLDRLDRQVFEDPQKALRWAEVAPRLALKVPEDDGPEGRRAHRENLLRSYAILGGAYRAVSRANDAEEPYRLALRIAESEAIRPALRVFLNQRLSYLRACQGRPEEALRLLDEALELQGPEPSTERSDSLVRRGYALAELERFPEAVECFADALQQTNPKESAAAAWVHHAAAHNLAYAVTKAKIGTDIGPVMDCVRKARKLLRGQRNQRNSVARWKLHWVEGLIWRRLAMDARAEQAFKVARHGFINLRLPWEIALVSLDLCAVHHEHGEWPELEALAADTSRRFKRLNANTHALTALSLCVNAARARRTLAVAAGQEEIEQAARNNAAAAISDAREVVIARMARP